MAKTKGEKPKTNICDLDTSPNDQSATNEVGFIDRMKVSLQSRYVQIVLIFTILGFFLRFYNITYNSIWLDEAATLDFARNSFIEIWNITANGEFNPPLFHWIEHFMLIFGSSELVLRFVPALLGSLTVPLFYWAGKESVDKNVGILSAALLTFCPIHIFYSQDARAYTTVLFFFTLALIFFYKSICLRKRRDWLLFGIFSAIAFWTHFYVMIPVLGMYCYAISVGVFNRKKFLFSEIKDTILSFGAFILISFPLILVTIRLFLIRTGRPPTYGLQGPIIITETIKQFSGLEPLVVIFFVVLFFIGMVEIWMQKKKCATFIGWILVLSLVMSVILSYSMPMIPRYLLFLLPLYFTAISASYKLLFNILQTPSVIYVLMCVFIIVGIPALSQYYTTYSKEDWRDIGILLPTLTEEGDSIFLLPSYLQMPFEYYYSSKSDNTYVFGASNIGELQDIVNRTPSESTRMFFIITADITATEPTGDTVRWLESNTQSIGGGTGIYIYTLPKTG